MNYICTERTPALSLQVPYTLGPAPTALLPTTCLSLQVESTAQGQMGSAPSLQADSNIVTINASELKSPHCIPVSISGAIFQMELSDCQQGSHQLLNSPGSLGGPTIMHTGGWSHTASGNGTPHNFREPRTGATHAPTIYGTIHPH